jgi:hypothetical protein
MPYQVFGDNSAAFAVTVAWTRSASARSSAAICAMLSRAAMTLGPTHGGASRFLIGSGSNSGLECAEAQIALVPWRMRTFLSQVLAIGPWRRG